jgi:hypothetical protein
MRVLFVLMVVSLPFLSGCSPIWQKAESTPNAVTSVEQMRITAAQGKAEAQFNLGVMYYEGRDVRQDYSQAAAWYRKAAEQGYAKAQFILGGMYKKGQGAPQDYTQAYMWLNLAAAREIANARETRDNLVKKLTPSQIEDGQRLAREWIAKHQQTEQ